MKDITNQYYYPKDIYNLISRYIQEKGYKSGLDPFPGWDAAIRLILRTTNYQPRDWYRLPHQHFTDIFLQLN